MEKSPELSNKTAETEEKIPLLDKIISESEKVPVTAEDTNYPSYEMRASPMGSISHLDEKEWKITRTDSFKDWFEGSKILDENKEPLVVNTRSRFKKDEKFELGTRQVLKISEDSWGKKGVNNFGFFFSEAPNLFHYGPFIKKAFLNIKNPFDVSDLSSVSTFEEFKTKLLEYELPEDDIKKMEEEFLKWKKERNKLIHGSEKIPEGWIKNGWIDNQATYNYFDVGDGGKEVREILIKNGFDGLKINDLEGIAYVAFHPEQILVFENKKDTN